MKKQAQEVRLCRDCRHAKAVTWEHLAADGTPIFCTCDFSRYYNFLNFDCNTIKNCEYYDTGRIEDSRHNR